MTNAWLGWFLTFIARVITDNTVMWEAQLCIVDRVFFQDSDSAADLEDSKSTSGGVLCIFGSRAFCPHQLDVQEANVSIPQFYRNSNHFVGCWIGEWTAPNEKSKRDVDQLSTVDIVPTNTHFFSRWVSVVNFLRTMKPWSRWSSKNEVQQWDTCPEPTELRLIGCSTESS